MIGTTHVGSLPRSQAVVDLLFARERGEPYDEAAFARTMREAVDETVRRQVEAGVGWVSGRRDVEDLLRHLRQGPLHRLRRGQRRGTRRRTSSGFRASWSGSRARAATPTYARPMCVGEVRSKGQGELEADIANLHAAMQAHGAARGFMNAASPGVISLFLQNDHYPTREAYLAALADVMREEYRTIVGAGLTLQLDCPDLALSRHMLFQDLTDAEFVRVAESHVEALSHALEGIDPDRVRVHICWGNYEGPHVCDIPMDAVFATLMRVPARHVLFETSNPRHAHE